VISLLDEIVDRGSPIQANRTLAVIRKMFNFAISRDIVDATPVAMVRAPAKENQRDRVLSAEEIRTFWKGLNTAPMSEGGKLVLKLQLATAQRKGEIVGAAMAEFDFEDNVWTIPAERSKNGQAHRVSLSPMALDLIEQARALGIETGNDDSHTAPENTTPAQSDTNRRAESTLWLFPSPSGEAPIKPNSINHALYRALPAIGLVDVTPHDLRRTAASGMTSLGISRLTVSKILNHVETGVTAVYDRHSYDNEKRHALDTWAAHLESVVSGKPAASNVVPLAAAGDAQ
jgi:integrase